MSEKQSFKILKRNLERRGDRIQRVENPIVPGMFDVNMKLRGAPELWVELKSPKREPLRDDSKMFGRTHRVLQTQIVWAKTQIQAGGKCFFYVDTDQNRYLIDGSIAAEINNMTRSEMTQRAVWCAPKPSEEEDWTDLRELLENCG